MPTYYLTKNTGAVPEQAIVMGRQKDSGEMKVGVALTEHGEIPGKVHGVQCWYSYGGKEHVTTDFKWVVAPHYAVELRANTGGGPPAGAIGVGHQKDSGVYYLAVANAGDKGTIPGKAQGNNCWYPYGGEEHLTQTFHWIVENNM